MHSLGKATNQPSLRRKPADARRTKTRACRACSQNLRTSKSIPDGAAQQTPTKWMAIQTMSILPAWLRVNVLAMTMQSMIFAGFHRVQLPHWQGQWP